MHIGVTATRRGLTAPQAIALTAWLTRLRYERRATHLHHGDCRGGDAEAADIAHELGYRTVAHPPTVPKLRAFHDSDEIRPLQHYHTRDRAIAFESNLLIGCPDTTIERANSGTWYTIRYAREIRRCLLVLGPAGQVMEYRPAVEGGAA